MNARPTLLPAALAAAMLLMATAAARAADTTEPAPAAAPARAAVDPLGAARGHIAARRWADGIAELRRVNAAGNADWNNLMGYALRKQGTPDLDGAQRHYDAALRIDPRHKGALEYSGELALMKGQLPVAEERLAALSRLCSTPCEELDDLKSAIQRYKANGNRWQP